ncbi:MAG: glycosyltransferase family protein [candidate division KSB1 bacterium]|nr:glycosyltransferase family protein [candidate division KSB1 bacterium]
MNIVYYITGHGYGHAIRAFEIIKALLEYPDISQITIKTTAPEWLFKPKPDARFCYIKNELDFGCIQSDSFYIDKKQTLARYAELLEQKSVLVNKETEFLKSQNINLILSDITPFAFDAAQRAGINSAAIGNFSWDWIYTQWLAEFPQYEFVVNDIRASYSKADILYRLPFHGDLSAFSKSIDTPLVGRRSNLAPEFVRDQIFKQISADTKLVFLGLRTTDLLGIDWDQLESGKHFTYLSQNRDIPGSGIINIQNSFEFYDLLSACDAVITKPGYSMVSEVIINKVPTLYVPRYDNIEDQPLIKGLEDYAVSRELPPLDFKTGNWHPHLETLFSKPNRWPRIKDDGASFIAETIMEGV